MLIDSAAFLRADCNPMNESSSTISCVFQHCWRGALCTIALLTVTSCGVIQGNGGLSGDAAPNVHGMYQGSYTYGGAYKKQAGQSVPFEISLQQTPGSSKIRGVIKETYTGFGTPKNGYLWANVSGTCEEENGFIHLKFTKTYRYSKESPICYSGSLPPGSSLLAGTWYLQDKTSDSGMFQISNIHAK